MSEMTELEKRILEPILHIGKRFYIFISILILIISVGAIAWIHQLQNGLGVTWLNQRVFWGIYITNFIFFIGISHAGTLISAILRVAQAEWRKPLTRMAEVITVIALLIGTSMVIIDLGRPDNFWLVPVKGRLLSPIFWDFVSISLYVTGSSLFLYLPMIPDIATLRDKYNEKPGFNFRKYLYRILALRWHGSYEQKERLERSMGIMAILIIPVAVSVHTVISWIFAMTWRVGWHSTIFGPYFVVGAIYSGIATIIFVMALFRKIYHFEDIITSEQFKYLGLLLLSFVGMYLYFTISEYLTSVYRGVEADVELLEELILGSYALPFWIFFFGGMIVPGILLSIACWKSESELAIHTITFASLLVIIGMWMKRFVIVVPSLARPFVANFWTPYAPTWIEIVITIAAIAGFILAYAIFSKLFPIISIWELMEDNETKNAETLSKAEKL
ncbi:MAG: NrfD/PsrC family molybdoenzyme membrane anchor subunit [Promethearchaeota archaeon]